MKEKEIVKYAMRELSHMFGLCAYQFRFSGSVCDFFCVNNKRHAIEVEHKSGCNLDKERNKTLRIDGTTTHRGLKHDINQKGERVSYFYYLIPAKYYNYYNEMVPDCYGLITYECHDYSTSLLDVVLVREANILNKKKVSISFLYDFAIICQSDYLIDKELPVNTEYIGFIDQKTRFTHDIDSICFHPDNLKNFKRNKQQLTK